MGRIARGARPDHGGRRLNAPLRLTIASVGRFRSGPERALFEHFRDRVGWRVELREVEVQGGQRGGGQGRGGQGRGGSAGKALIRREAGQLAAACPAGARRVALDATGTALSSEVFARHLGGWRDAGEREIAFLIGGADGLDADLVAGCALVVSYGIATWPHLLVRAMLMEQIYRAQQILAGHPYHRGK